MPEKSKSDIAIGIDLGTTNSLAAVVRNGKPLALSGEHGPLVPSVIGIRGHEVIIGRRAYDSMVDNPEQTVFSVKRLIGKSIRDLDGGGAGLPFKIIADGQGLASIEIDRRTYSPVELSAAILREIKRQAEMALRQIISRAVITVPAYFDDVQRQATRDAGRIAGLEVLRIINEPTAAALAYGLDRMKQGLVAVYDLGGGTFDVSILKLESGIFEVLSTAGDTRLGGDDFDAALAGFLAEEITGQGVFIDRTSPKSKALLKRRAEEAKKTLSGSDKVTVSLNIDGLDRVIEITRERFETMISPIVARTFSLCRRALADAGLSVRDLDAVILVGGSTRVPLVRREVERFFGRTPRGELGPDEVVALGAAVQADILTGGRDDLLLLDVTPLSLGIEILGGVMNVLIRRNSKIPAVAKEMFTTYVDGQTAVAIRIFQGERELVAGNRLLGDFTLTGIAPVKAGLPRIEVDFTLDADGILNVRARETRSGQSQDIVVRPAYGLTEDEVKRMVRSSFIHARDDIEKRLVIELSQEAARVIEATEKSLPEVSHYRPGEREEIEAALAEMRKALTGEDSHTLRLALDKLNEATADLAARLVNSHLRGLLKGKTVGETKKLVNKGT